MTGNNNNYHRLINRDDCIVVIIDVQEKLMPVISERDRVIDNTVKLVEFSNISGVPVIVTEQEKLGNTVETVKNRLRNVDPIEKVHFNCFWNKQFKEQIDAAERKTLIVAGVEAHICVAQTALYSIRDYRIHVVGDAVSSRSPDNKALALQRMRDAGAVITSTEMFIYEILVKAGTEEFKATLPLVK